LWSFYAFVVDDHWDRIKWLAFVLREVGGTLTGEAVRVALRGRSG
jgi:hypothetical protein